MNVSLGIRPFRQPLPTVGLRVRGLQAGPAEAPPGLLLHGGAAELAARSDQSLVQTLARSGGGRAGER